ncbi:hypothetical protein M9435_004950 [Picochlorum sp. BPE23]|nr:hypothetical protein M9435_004950 [Picochlorum sp. BPE23]
MKPQVTKHGRLIRPVSESARIDIAKVIADFQASDEQEHAFPPDLTNHERAIVHNECKKYGLISKSFGKGSTRAVHVFKQRKQRSNNETCYTFSLQNETLSRIEAYLERFPPSRDEISTIVGESQAAVDGRNMLSQSYTDAAQVKGHGKVPHKKARQKRAMDMEQSEITSRHDRWLHSMNTGKGKDMERIRKSLPIAKHKEEILQAVESSQVVLIAGETGCGKTTQVPQYILESCWEKGKPCRVMCTQPRRLSATSVAERIAQERCESIGDNVGYTIRLDKKGGDDTAIMFCTNGIMLRMLTSTMDNALDDVTHIVVDEIHERDRFADFMLICIRDILPKYPQLRLILMSATLHEDLFSKYFGGCPIIRVPGFTFPVKDYFLEDVLRITGYEQAAMRQLSMELGHAPSHTMPQGSISKKKAKALSEAIESAFKQGDDDDFERLLELTGSADTESLHDENVTINFQHPDNGTTALFCACFHGRGDIVSILLANGADPSIRAQNGMTPVECARQFGHEELANLIDVHTHQVSSQSNIADAALALSHYQSNTDVDDVDIGLIEELLLFVCGEKRQGKAVEGLDAAISAVESDASAILIFLPGWDEIMRLKDALDQSGYFGNPQKYIVLPLHSMVSPVEQRKVFQRPPRNVRKIILSTNIAETAITIDDVALIIDSGRQKEKSFDPYSGVSTLQSGWISKASAKQRKGRAGRCRKGLAFHMYSRQRYEAMDEYQAPELMRTPLEEMGLQVKLIDDNTKIGEFLSKAVEPPVSKAVDSAIKLLENIGAIEEGTEKLTVLGSHLARLPIPPKLGKLLLYGVLFDCLDPILTLSCCLAYRDPWVLPASVDGRRRASQIKVNFSSRGSGFSDHLATAVAYNEWKQRQRSGNGWTYCNQNFLNNATMTMIDGMRTQLLGELMDKGFITSLESASSKATRLNLVRSVIALGLYPNIGRVAANPRRDQKSKAAMINARGERVRVHPSSVNISIKNPVDTQEDLGRPSLLVYDELTRGDAVIYVKSCTEVNPHAAFLVSSHLTLTCLRDDDADDAQNETISESVRKMDINEIEELQSMMDDTTRSFWQAMESFKDKRMLLTVDGWLRFSMPASSALYISILRQRLVSAFAFRASHPKTRLPHALTVCVNLIGNILDKDGQRLYSSQNDASSVRQQHRKPIHPKSAPPPPPRQHKHTSPLPEDQKKKRRHKSGNQKQQHLPKKSSV